MELYIVRHGETLWNREKRLQGREDIELSENGREGCTSDWRGTDGYANR